VVGSVYEGRGFRVDRLSDMYSKRRQQKQKGEAQRTAHRVRLDKKKGRKEGSKKKMIKPISPTCFSTTGKGGKGTRGRATCSRVRFTKLSNARKGAEGESGAVPGDKRTFLDLSGDNIEGRGGQK